MRERRRLVKSFDELRSGMIVIGTGCRNCGRDHRAMLTVKIGGRGDAWGWCPITACGMYGVVAAGVRQRRVYRIDTGLEPPAEYAREISRLTRKSKVPARKKAGAR